MKLIFNMLKTKKGFTLIDLLVAIAIISILSSIVFVYVGESRERSKLARAFVEMKSIADAAEAYKADTGVYPLDVERGVLPAELRDYYPDYYANGQKMPIPPWSESFYDWENWPAKQVTEGGVTENYGPTYQVSVLFCIKDETNVNNCKFPKTNWATNFDLYSSVYYCVSGDCRAYFDRLKSYPAYPLN